MDDRGFIFTTDATLALVVFMVLATAFVSYYILPSYSGEDHQHLERIAADALRIMHQDGTLYTASVYYAAGNDTAAENLLTSSLNYLIPPEVGYKLTLDKYGSVEDNRGISSISSDIVTRVDVISGPKEGWMGRAWYKVEKAEFIDQQVNVTTTLWNFHNWLTNFEPWNSYGLRNRPYWGGGSSPTNIRFSIPINATITNAYFLAGSCNFYNGPSYAVDANVNGYHHYNSSPFTFLNYRPGTNARVYNYQGNILPTELTTGTNNFYVNFLNMTGSEIDRYDMPWFALIGNYTTTMKVPQGLLTSRFDFPDAAGLAVPNPQDLNGSGTADQYGRIYDLGTGTVTSFTTRRVMSWTDFTANRNTLDDYDDGIPFVITNLPNVGGTGHGSAVSVVSEFYIPEDSTRILDAALYLNIYGATDNALVEYWDGSQWRTAFCSFNFDGTSYSARSDGYGNIPGIIYLGDKLQVGNNKVRVTVWDHVPSSDYDLVL
ncbi:MAG: hypothetical protein FJ150_06725 [Euryarchaeota archaeon]|nr:hypothetical protein [Euryarchaeota archaeon]